MNESASQPENPAVSAIPKAEKRPDHGVEWIFLGPNGLRAGWAMLLFAFIFAATDFLIGWAFRPLLLSMAQGATHVQTMSLRLGLLAEGSQAPGVFVATIAMALIERRSILSYGYKGSARALRFFSGLGWGFIAISSFILLLWKAHYLSLDGLVLHGSDIWKFAAGWGLMFLLVGVFEESTLRGYLQYTFTRGVGFWWGALLFSFLFGFAHGTNPGETHVGLFSAGAVGLVFCLSLWYTGSLWWAVGFHAAWDWGESFFYGTSDSGLVARGHLFAEHPVGNMLFSGGATGPEGSLLALPLLAVIAILMWLWWGRRNESPFKAAAWRPAPPVQLP